MTKNQKDYKPVPVKNRKMVRAIMKNTITKTNGGHKVSKNMHNMFSRVWKHEETVDANKHPIKAYYTQKGRRHASTVTA